VTEAIGRDAPDQAEKRFQEGTAESLGEWSVMREPVRRKALDTLVGTRIRVRTPDLRVSGKITKVEGESLSIQRIFQINGQERAGSVATVAFTALPAEQRKRLLDLPEPARDAEQIGAAIAFLGAGRLDKAANRVGRIKDPEQRAVMAWYVTIRQWRDREHAARTEWEKLGAAGRAASTSEAARPVWRAVQSFDKTYQGTREHWRIRKERKKLNAKLKVLSEGQEEIVRRVFGDSVKAFDPVTHRLRLHLNFRNKRHVDLLKRSSAGVCAHVGSISVNKNNSPGILFTRAFATRELEVTLHCRSHNHYRPEWHKGIWLGIPANAADAVAEKYRDAEGFQILWNPSGVFSVVAAGPNGLRTIKSGKGESTLIFTVKVRLKANRLSVIQKHKNGNASEVLSCDVNGTRPCAGIGFGMKGPRNNQILFYSLSVTGLLDDAWVKAAIAKRIDAAQRR
jgi:hypothetical protein